MSPFFANLLNPKRPLLRRKPRLGEEPAEDIYAKVVRSFLFPSDAVTEPPAQPPSQPPAQLPDQPTTGTVPAERKGPPTLQVHLVPETDDSEIREEMRKLEEAYTAPLPKKKKAERGKMPLGEVGGLALGALLAKAFGVHDEDIAEFLQGYTQRREADIERKYQEEKEEAGEEYQRELFKRTELQNLAKARLEFASDMFNKRASRTAANVEILNRAAGLQYQAEYADYTGNLQAQQEAFRESRRLYSNNASNAIRDLRDLAAKAMTTGDPLLIAAAIASGEHLLGELSNQLPGFPQGSGVSQLFDSLYKPHIQSIIANLREALPRVASSFMTSIAIGTDASNFTTSFGNLAAAAEYADERILWSAISHSVGSALWKEGGTLITSKGATPKDVREYIETIGNAMRPHLIYSFAPYIAKGIRNDWATDVSVSDGGKEQIIHESISNGAPISVTRFAEITGLSGDQLKLSYKVFSDHFNRHYGKVINAWKDGYFRALERLKGYEEIYSDLRDKQLLREHLELEKLAVGIELDRARIDKLRADTQYITDKGAREAADMYLKSLSGLPTMLKALPELAEPTQITKAIREWENKAGVLRARKSALERQLQSGKLDREAIRRAESEIQAINGALESMYETLKALRDRLSTLENNPMMKSLREVVIGALRHFGQGYYQKSGNSQSGGKK